MGFWMHGGAFWPKVKVDLGLDGDFAAWGCLFAQGEGGFGAGWGISCMKVPFSQACYLSLPGFSHFRFALAIPDIDKQILQPNEEEKDQGFPAPSVSQGESHPRENRTKRI
jgi:hypothetical protein